MRHKNGKNIPTEHKQHPRLLVMLLSPFQDDGYGKILTELFNCWPKENLAQFYISDDTPSFSVCGNFFRITDMDIVKANLNFKVAKGTVFTKKSNRECEREPKAASIKKNIVIDYLIDWMRKYSRHFMSTILNIGWRKNKWLSQSLMSWLEEYKPQAVFFYCYKQPHFHKIAHWICKHYKIPLFIYVTDDYTFYPSAISPFAWINYCQYMRHFKKSIHLAKKLYAFNPEMREMYRNRFKLKNVGVLMNALSIDDNVSNENLSQSPIRLIFAGNIYYERWKTLCFLAECLMELHEQGYSVVLDIFCPYPIEKKIQDSLTKPPISHYNGVLDHKELQSELSKSNVLVHVESFKKKNIKATRFAISIKISDYMVSNRMILAIGPKEVASMKYLERNELALCLNTMCKSKAVSELKKIFDIDYRSKLSARGRELAKENHDARKIQADLYKDLCDIAI